MARIYCCYKTELFRRALNKGFLVVKLFGKSMSPTLQPGFSVTLTNTLPLVEGDVAVYVENKTFVCHRIIMIRGAKHYFLGDARPIPDRVVLKSEILGKVIDAKDLKGRKVSKLKLTPGKLFIRKQYLLFYQACKKLLTLKAFDVALRNSMIKWMKKFHDYAKV